MSGNAPGPPLKALVCNTKVEEMGWGVDMVQSYKMVSA